MSARYPNSYPGSQEARDGYDTDIPSGILSMNVISLQSRGEEKEYDNRH
jgi:hypothetical protein